MKSMKLNAAEMASLYGGRLSAEQRTIEPDGSCMSSSKCSCHPRQPDAKVKYGENMANSDKNFGT